MTVDCRSMRHLIAFLVLLFAVSARAQVPAAVESDFIVKDFRFQTGEVLPEVRIHYATIGKFRRTEHGTNAVLVLHGTGGSLQQFLSDRFAGVLFKPGGVLDASRYFIVIPDNIGHGKSSKPSDGLRSKFPHYGYSDMVELQHRLLVDGLGVNHLHLVMGTSMGGMQTWMWGERWPDAADALVPLASAPAQIAGRNRMWRKMMIDDLKRNDVTRGRADPPACRKRAAAVAEGGSDARRRRSLDRRPVENADRHDRWRRSAVCDRIVERLRPVLATREDHRAAAGHQLRGRFHQSAGARHPRSGHETRQARTIRPDPGQRGHARPQHAHVGGGLGAAVARLPGDERALNP